MNSLLAHSQAVMNGKPPFITMLSVHHAAKYVILTTLV